MSNSKFLIFSVGFLFSSFANSEVPEKSESLARQLTARGAQKSSEPYLRPSEVLAKIPPTKQKQFLRKFLAKILSRVKTSDSAKTLVEESFAFKKEDSKFWLDVAVLKENAMAALVNEIYRSADLETHPERLDAFPTVPIESLPAIQTKLFASGTYSPLPENYRPRAFGLTYPKPQWKSVTFKQKGCPRLKREYLPYDAELNLYTGMEPVHDAIVDCFAGNSESLSQLLNVLANVENGETVSATVNLVEDPDRVYSVTSYETLIRALGQMGFTLELYNTRVLVDFMGFSFLDEGVFKSVRGATWFNVPIKNGRVRVPAEHGEINFMLRKGKVRFAASHWFFGIPDPKFNGTATFWRAHLYLQASWADVLNEKVEIYPPETNSENLNLWFKATTAAMKGFQGIYDEFRPPFNSYGIFICSDSMTFALGLHLELSRTKNPPHRLTDAFPTLYAKNIWLEKIGRSVAIDQLFAKYSNLSENILTNYAVPDQALAKTPEAMQARLARTFATKDDPRLIPFADFKSDGLAKIRH